MKNELRRIYSAIKIDAMNYILYLNTYREFQSLVDTWLVSNELTMLFLQKYSLIRMYDLYRISDYQASEFRSHSFFHGDEVWMQVARTDLGIQFDSAEEYLKLVKLKQSDDISAAQFFNFVVSDEEIGM